jgi:hypothetical protein
MRFMSGLYPALGLAVQMHRSRGLVSVSVPGSEEPSGAKSDHHG